MKDPASSYRQLCRLGVRQKAVLALLAVLLVALTASGALLLRDMENAITEETNRRGAELAEFFSHTLAYRVVAYDYHTVQKLLDQLIESEDIAFIQVLSPRGNVMAQAGDASAEQPLVFFEQPVLLDNEPVGGLTLGLTNTNIARQIEEQKWSLVKREAAIILLIAIGEFLVLSLIIIRPVTSMSRALNQNMDERGLIPRDLPVHSHDELGDMAERFNALRRQLNEAHEELHQKYELTDQQLHEAYDRLVEQADDLRRANADLENLAITDALTGLRNRRHFDNVMRSEVAFALRHAEPHSLLLLDLDYFKNVNDCYGHATGDRILKEFADLVKNNVRETDVLCRLGGEEFAVFCRRADRQDGVAIAEKLREATAGHVFNAAGRPVGLTVSIGVSTLSPGLGINSPAELYASADLALYASKSDGRNRTTHVESIQDQHRAKGERDAGS